MKAEKGTYAGYIGMKIVLAIAAGIIFGIATFIVILILAIPLAIIGVMVAGIASGAGLSWNALTITLTIVAGSIGFFVLLYLVVFISTPVTVFFPAYSIHFLASRYPKLDALLHPAACLRLRKSRRRCRHRFCLLSLTRWDHDFVMIIPTNLKTQRAPRNAAESAEKFNILDLHAL